ncbi:5-oxoprolinase [Enhygromyxa salina]|uniref:5-oxoprolinase n=1 Tax=Enhygromyxa salina TaxID=215803 RepID=A0A0C1ZSS8_9BACT|nr:hydantoinase B/oxoprolinase family protein [Enhygromyxa salina]KIG14118.1 5-oxoprolinase [Enhygromyxa salina]
MVAPQQGWEFWIDRGGTFTDVVARDPSGSLRTHKLLSEHPEQYADAALEGIRVLLGLERGQALPAELIRAVKMGTTVATNALLERQGARTLLAINAGFRDALRIGYQHRPRLFDRQIVLPSMLYEQIAEIDARVDAHGLVLQPLDPAQIRAALAPARALGIEAIAIVLMHGWRFPAHEQAVAKIARELGFSQVSVSHQVSPLAKLIGRGDTTVVDAYLSPILRGYVGRVAKALGDVPLQFMQSSGGLTDATRFAGKDAILSGPAGGIVGAVVTSASAGFDAIIGFDMGGTSTDVAHYAGRLERSFESEVAGVRVRAPMLEVHTVAAGGGSICRVEHGRYRVGPASAGADPGPACYRRGGPLTVTDCNVMLGKIQPQLFPRVFGPSADQPIDVARTHALFSELAEALAQTPVDPQGSPELATHRSPVEVAEGFIEIAVANMADAIKKISSARGHDLNDHALCCFGGAGGQHACLVADALGMRTVLIHPFAGVLSAYGMGLADVRALRERSLGVELEPGALADADAQLDELVGLAVAELRAQAIAAEQIEQLCGAQLRYAGSDRPLPITWIRGPDTHARVQQMRAQFELEHRERYGFDLPGDAVVVDALTAEAVASGSDTGPGTGPDTGSDTAGIVAHAERPTPISHVAVRMAGETRDTPVYERERLALGASVSGPAIIAEPTGTTIVEPGWAAVVRDTGHLVLTRAQPRADQSPSDETELERPDPVRLELFNNLYGSIAEQMGATLCNTAHSVNIKERLDFSCAVFDAEGQLIANAPHMPVHLGSMGASVRAVIRSRANGQHSDRGIQPGDSFAVNAPYNGGTHLPDVTVITPVFMPGSGEARGSSGDAGPVFFVASRGHHADIGGKTPGSMPADSRHVDEEGVLFDDFLLVERGQLRREAVRERLASGRWPARDPSQNLADLEAQLAANHQGVNELRRLVQRWTLPIVRAYMRHVRANAASSVRAAIRQLTRDHAHERRFEYGMDDGSVIVVHVRLDADTGSCRVDFTGTSAQRPNNFNAPYAVCQAAVLYVFRTLVDAEIPMNEGCLDPIELIVPAGCMLRPSYPAAVVAGNVETSQAVVDALYGALGVMAAAQGTMNNLTFGNARHQYYETVCGGSGAGPGFDGTDAVHTHMTNSRLTDPEILEQRFPVVLERFEIRRGSGGRGTWRGGDGVRRRLRFGEAMELVILANRREIPPYGVAGGEPGAVGRNWIERADGSVVELAATDSARVEAGDAFVLETPGGGGWGPAREIE